MACWSFFMPENQHRGRGEPASPDGIAQDMLDYTAQWTIDEQRIYVARISSGGGVTAALAADFKSVLVVGRPDGLSAVRWTAATLPWDDDERRATVLRFLLLSARDSIAHSRTT